jgi:hypothetical protein
LTHVCTLVKSSSVSDLQLQFPYGSDILFGYIFFYSLAEIAFNQVLDCSPHLFRIFSSVICIAQAFHCDLLLDYPSLMEAQLRIFSMKGTSTLQRSMSRNT